MQHVQFMHCNLGTSRSNIYTYNYISSTEFFKYLNFLVYFVTFFKLLKYDRNYRYTHMYKVLKAIDSLKVLLLCTTIFIKDVLIEALCIAASMLL